MSDYVDGVTNDPSHIPLSSVEPVPTWDPLPERRQYARLQDGVVIEMLDLEAGEAPLELRLHPSLVAACILLTGADLDCVQPGWELRQGAFSAPVEAPPAPVVSPTLTARQLRLALTSIGVTRAVVEAQIASIEDAAAREVAMIEWEYSTTYERTHPLIAQVGGALGLSETQIDALWENAATL